MATIVAICPEITPGYTHNDVLAESSAKKVSEYLMSNHRLYHTRWKATFHNHLVHHLLALWALGATEQQVTDMWNYNQPYQTAIETEEVRATSVNKLDDAATFKQCLGNNSRYADYLRLFEREIDNKGVPATLQKYMFSGSDIANEVFCRMFSDLLHPVIHLGCGLEFLQPSLVAEALAGACVHETWPGIFLFHTEQYSASNPGVKKEPFLETLLALRADTSIREGVKDTDPFNKVADGLLTRVTPEQLAPYLAKFNLGSNPSFQELQQHMVDLMYTCAYLIAAAQQPGKRESMDFVTLHTATMCAFYPVFLAQDWLSTRQKARFLEAGARTSAVMYAACGSPPLFTERIQSYTPRRPDDGWAELFQRAIVYRDEGHAAKLIRALYCTEQLGDPDSDLPIVKADLLKIAHMGMDSIEMAFDESNGNYLPAAAPGIMSRVGRGGEMVVNNMTRWVFYGGLNHSWDHVPSLGHAQS